ncbi:UDP-glucose 4-epimerase GalE [Paramicrobacterium agarici]|uniref:UDP-glucose 4-epimerase GalE n=1 Tax=Paramicrobacterium agarici TaxID=630514 RepID=UPI001151B1E0|nr:UDP-glucose 4-epimerase GalE [Microbacterium agarici]TQO21780.1 UDP-galactose 4-epimerase [Microbacterium agarici]
MSVLVTGGAGYIGSHIVRKLQQSSDVVVVDNFSTGHRDRIKNVPVYDIDLAAASAIRETRLVLRQHDVRAVVHMAALKQVGESVEQPLRYYRENTQTLAHVLEAMNTEGVPFLVFSSSAAVYGNPAAPLVREEDETKPVNPYGSSKLMGEWLVRDVAKATSIRAVSLRYFNVAGAGAPELADTVPANLITLAIDALARGSAPQVFGDDYDTPDGSGVRDYVHVEDLASAHLAAIDYLLNTHESYSVFNVGTGIGASVKEVLAELAQASRSAIRPQVAERRAGDPAAVVADAARIKERFAWTPKHSIRDMVKSAWDAQLRTDD